MAGDRYADRRKTKRDKKAKARYNKYKKGGRHRASNFRFKGKCEEK